MAGTALFLAVSLPLNGRQILHTPHYGEKTAWEAFHLLKGMEYTYRSLADNLFLGLAGICGVTLPLGLVFSLLVGLVAGAMWWWQRAPARRLLLLGLGFIFLSYVLVFSARSEWTYDGTMTGFAFCRYHLLPQMGFALFVCGGLPAADGHLMSLQTSGRLTPRQVKCLLGITCLLFVSQLPRCLAAPPRYDPAQQVVLGRIEKLERLCIAKHIPGDLARKVLIPARLEMPMCGDQENGWDLLRGCPDPWPTNPEDARRILASP
jgi:hypothetical protein